MHHPASAQTHPDSGKLVLDHPGNAWIDSFITPIALAPDGQWALVGRGPEAMHLYSLRTGKEEDSTLMGGLGALDDAVFCGAGSPALARLGQRGLQKGWFLPEQGSLYAAIPPGSTPVCSPDGKEVAYLRASTADGKLAVVTADGKSRGYEIKGKPTAMVFSHEGDLLYVTSLDPNGESFLLRIDVHTGEQKVLAARLDASKFGGPVALSPDGKRAYLPLVSEAPPDDEARQKPDAARWLQIYELDLATGSLRPVVSTPGQDNAEPAIANGSLYWVRTVIHASIATVPLRGGAAKQIVAGGQLPIWRPDGSQIGYFFGSVRMADGGLATDAAVVGMDAKGNRTSGPSVIISGYHEDFSPAWSPDGRWIAFHSHRSATALPQYGAPGSADDIFLRRADDPHAPEMRLTDFGWEAGPAFWSPDGHKLLFNSWQRGGTPEIYKLWVLTMNTERGAVVKTEMLPLPESIRSARWAAWSPDGREIAIEDDRGAGKRTLWITKADGSGPTRVLDYRGTTYDGLDWTRDGQTLIYSGLAGERLQLFAVARSGGAPRQLTHDSANLMHPRVSPDGQQIACTRMEQSKQLWRRPLRGGPPQRAEH